jgi:hypothetical protein
MFEYEIVNVVMSNPECKEYLNEMGKENWEAISFDANLVSEFDSKGYMRYRTKITFKRKLQRGNK